METNKKETSQCGLHAEIVAYLYGEATPVEREQFETHLLACTPCTDEFAELSDARFSVFEWQREEFAPLATPSIVIPYPSPQKAGILAGLRSILDLGWPAFATAAAILLTLFGLGIWAIQPKLAFEEQVALNERPDTLSVTNGSAALDVRTPGTIDIPEDVTRTDGGVAVVNARAAAPKTAATRYSRRALPRSTNMRRLEKEQTVSALQKPADRLPHLTAAADEEDGSLRLSDLFDNVEDKL